MKAKSEKNTNLKRKAKNIRTAWDIVVTSVVITCALCGSEKSKLIIGITEVIGEQMNKLDLTKESDQVSAQLMMLIHSKILSAVTDLKQ